MGYSATEVRREGDLTIAASRVHILWDKLKAAERDGGIGHISWCQVLTEYTGTEAERCAEVLDHFGFDGSHVDSLGNVQVGTWGGGKIGLSWGGVLKALSHALPVGSTVELVMIGEDNSPWVSVLNGGNDPTERAANIS